MADISSVPYINYAQNTADASLTQAQVPVARANAGLIQQQTQAAATANQVAQLKLKLFQGAMAHLNDFSNQSPTSADMSAVSGQSAQPGQPGQPQNADTSGTAASPYDIGLSPADPGAVAKSLKQQYFVNPVGTPEEQAKIVAGYYSGDDGLAKGTVAQRDMGVAQRTYQNQIQASALYDTMDAVNTADPGNAVAQLKAVAPNTAAQIEKAARNPDGSENEDQADQMARDYAAHIGVEAHQYTGRETKRLEDGTPVDAKTEMPVHGATSSGLSASAYGTLFDQANKMVNVYRNGKETQVPTYEAEGYKTADSWIRSSQAKWAAQHQPIQQSVHPAVIQAAQQGAAQTAQKVIQAHQQQQQGGAQPASGQQPAAPAGAPGTPSGGVQTGATQTAATGSGLTPEQQNYVRSAPVTPTPGNTGNAKPSDADMDLQKKYNASKLALLDESKTDSAQAQNTLLSVSRAQALLDKNPVLGPGSGIVSTIGTLVQNMTGQHAANLIESNSAVHDLLLKTLGADQLNHMLSQLHGEGAQVRLGAQESKLILGSLSANTQISKGAIQQMLNWEKSDAQYTLGKANTARAWVSSGRDPTAFNYEGTFAKPTANLTNSNSSGGQLKTKSGSAYSQKQVDQWVSTHAAKFGGDTNKAKAWLMQQ